jgi:hypothetical protein
MEITLRRKCLLNKTKGNGHFVEVKGNLQTLTKPTTLMMNQMNAHPQSIRSTDFLGCLSLHTLPLSRPNLPAGLPKIIFFIDINSCGTINI